MLTGLIMIVSYHIVITDIVLSASNFSMRVAHTPGSTLSVIDPCSPLKTTAYWMGNNLQAEHHGTEDCI